MTYSVGSDTVSASLSLSLLADLMLILPLLVKTAFKSFSLGF